MVSQWLVNALTAAELPVICVETRHMKALLTDILAKSSTALEPVIASKEAHDQRHQGGGCDAVKCHGEAGEGPGNLVLLKRASRGDTMTRQTHRKTASVPFLDTDQP